MKFVIQLLMGIRTALLKIAGKIFEKIRDPETGKIKLGSPQDVKRVAVMGFFIFIAGVAAYQIFNSTFNPIDGVKDFDSELKGKLDITAQEIPYNKEISGDPLSKIRGLEEDVSSRRGLYDDDSVPPRASECNVLLTKLKSGANLGNNEKQRLKYCLENNLLGLSAEELALAKRLLDNSILSEEEKRLYNELFAAEPACKEVFEKQIATPSGNSFITAVMNDNELNAKLMELLKNPPRMRQLIITPNGLKTNLGISDSDVEVLKALLENCTPELLIKMFTDPKMKEILSKLLAEAQNNPDFARLLNQESLTPSEEALLKRFLNGEIAITDPDYALAKALLSTDPSKRDMARDALAARELGLNDLANALVKQLNGEMLSPEEAALLNYDAEALRRAAEARRSGDNDIADILMKQLRGAELSDDEKALLGNRAEFGNLPTGVDKEALAKAIAEDIARRQAEIDALQEALARAQATAREAAERLAQGLPLSPEQQAALQRFADLQKQLADLQSKLQEQKDRLANMLTTMQSTIDQIGMGIQTLYPSGMTVELNDWTKCKDIKPLILVKKQKPKGGAVAKKKGVFGPDGIELTPDQIKVIQLMRKQKADQLAEKERLEKELLNAGQALSGQTVSLNSVLAQGAQAQGGISALIVSENSNLRPFQLAPDLLVPGLLLTRILVSDKGAGQKVRVKITADVYDLAGKIAIPRNSIAFGTTGGFDVETGIMNITLDTVSVGGKTVDMAFEVGSADLSPGLKGEVRDTRGKLLLGAFISSFTSGAVGALSQNYIAPFQNSELLSDSLAGAGLQGAAQIAQRIASLYAGDLQNAARIFYAPENIRVILSPSR